MAKVSVECPSCFAKLNLPDRSKIGKKIKCPKCAEVFVAETPEEDDADSFDDDEPPVKSSTNRKKANSASGKKQSKKSSKDSEGSSNVLLIGGGIAGLVVVIGAGLFFAGVFGGAKPPAPAAPPVVADAAPAPAPVAAPPAAPVAEISPTEKTLALRWMPADTELILHVKVSDLWQAPLLKGLIETPQVATQVAEMQKLTGITPADVESVTIGMSGLKQLQSVSMMAAMGMPPEPNQFKGLVVARSKKALSQSSILSASPTLKAAEHSGKSYFLLPSPTGVPGKPTDEVGGWVADPNTFVMGGLPELKAAMEKGETVTPRKELAFADATWHIVLVVAPTDPQSTSQGMLPPALPGVPPEIAEMQQAITESMQGFGLGVSIRGGFDLQTSLLMKDSVAAAKIKKGLDVAVAEGRKQFDALKVTAPPLLGELGQMLIDNLKVNEQSQVVKVSVGVPDSAQPKLEQLPPLLMVMAATGGFNSMAGPPMVGGEVPTTVGDLARQGEAPSVDSVIQEGIPAGVTLTAKTYRQSPDSALAMDIMLDAKGEGLKAICGYGMVSLKNATLDGGKPLKLATDALYFGPDPVKMIVPFDYEGEAGEFRTENHPSECMRVLFRVDPPEGNPTQITVLEGSFSYFTSDKSEEFTISDVPKTVLRPLSDPKLKAAGVKLLLGKDKNTGRDSLTLSCGKGHLLGTVWIRDLSDENSRPQFVQPMIEKGLSVWRDEGLWLNDKGKYPEKLQMKFKLHPDIKEQKVSFRFENVPLPKFDVKPTSQNQ